ncbi:unnamed protein product, partial [Heterotrigona itama]
MFGSSGACAGCGNAIPATELVMRAGGSVFHQKCFTCSKCGNQLVSGDRYYLLSGSPVCETDWHKIVKSSSVAAAAAAAAAGNGGAPKSRMRWQPGRSPEEGTSLSAADAGRRTVTGRRCGRRCRRGSLFAASAGSSAVPPSSPPPSPSSSDGTRTSGTGGTANAPAGVHLPGVVSVGTGHLRLNNQPRSTTYPSVGPVSWLNESSPWSRGPDLVAAGPLLRFTVTVTVTGSKMEERKMEESSITLFVRRVLAILRQTEQKGWKLSCELLRFASGFLPWIRMKQVIDWCVLPLVNVVRECRRGRRINPWVPAIRGSRSACDRTVYVARKNSINDDGENNNLQHINETCESVQCPSKLRQRTEPSKRNVPTMSIFFLFMKINAQK